MASTSSTSRRVLVTGGAGFIGSHLVELLLQRGDQVTVVDDLSTGRRQNLPQSSSLRFVHKKVSEAVATDLANEKFDEIYHLAASVGVKLVVDDPVSCIENNVHETSALVRFAMKAGIGQYSQYGVPTLLASTSEVYGKAEKTPFQEDDDVTYGPTTMFRWVYAQSKALDEYLGLALHKQKQFPAVITRFFNTVGPRQVGDYGMVLPRFVQAALRNEPLRVFGDGKQTRCFCDVRDVVAVLPKLVESRGCWGRVFNIGSDRVISIRDLAELVIKTLSSQSVVEMVPYHLAFPAGGSSGSGGAGGGGGGGGGFEDLRQRRPDSSRVRDAVGFSPTIQLTQTILDVATSIRSESR
ncbi:MAG: GDP-mannose 4,6-dehydratase [Phycisphaerales bacterium]